MTGVFLLEGASAEVVTPGPLGFIITAALGVFIILLGVDMARRIRRARYRDRVRREKPKSKLD